MTAQRITRVDVLPDGDRVRIQYRTLDGKRRQVTLRKSQGAGLLSCTLYPSFNLTLAVKCLYEVYPASDYTFSGYLALPVCDLKAALMVKLATHLPHVTLQQAA